MKREWPFFLMQIVGLNLTALTACARFAFEYLVCLLGLNVLVFIISHTSAAKYKTYCVLKVASPLVVWFFLVIFHSHRA